MPALNTVLGSVHPEQMGIAAVHEHVLWPPGDGADRDAGWLAELPKTFERHHTELTHFRLNGGRTIVDVSAPGAGRDLDLLVLLAKSSRLNIAASTGVAKKPGSRGTDADSLEELFTRELTAGMGTTRITAGIIAIRVRQEWPESAKARVLRAAAHAGRKIGAAVSVHGVDPEPLVEALIREGLPPERIIAGHLDARADPDRDKRIARRGAYLSYDHIGVEQWAAPPFGTPNARRVELVKAMIGAGCGERILLSCDSNSTELGRPGPPLHAVAHLLQYFVPLLRGAGIDEQTVDLLLVQNPKRVIPMQ